MSHNNPIDAADPEEQPQPENPENPPPVPPAERRPENQNQPKETWKDLTKWGKFERVFKVLEVVGIAAGFAVLLVLVGQYCEMVKATKVTEGQLKAMQSQSDVMQGQLNEMRRTRILDERAWVAPIQSGLIISPIGDSGSTFVQIQYKNTGKTPAVNAVCIFGSTTNFDDIGKNEGYPTNSSNFGMIPPDVISHSDIGAINGFTVQDIKGGMTYYIFGKIWYDDIFGNRHWTTFSYLIETNFTEYFSTAIHNSCDDAETNQTN
jgi:hypothetical protein